EALTPVRRDISAAREQLVVMVASRECSSCGGLGNSLRMAHRKVDIVLVFDSATEEIVQDFVRRERIAAKLHRVPSRALFRALGGDLGGAVAIPSGSTMVLNRVSPGGDWPTVM